MRDGQECASRTSPAAGSRKQPVPTEPPLSTASWRDGAERIAIRRNFPQMSLRANAIRKCCYSSGVRLGDSVDR